MILFVNCYSLTVFMTGSLSWTWGVCLLHAPIIQNAFVKLIKWFTENIQGSLLMNVAGLAVKISAFVYHRSIEDFSYHGPILLQFYRAFALWSFKAPVAVNNRLSALKICFYVSVLNCIEGEWTSFYFYNPCEN